MGPCRPLFRLFNAVVSEDMNFADDWIQTSDLCCQKRPLYQLSQHHCPFFYYFCQGKCVSKPTYLKGRLKLEQHCQNLTV